MQSTETLSHCRRSAVSEQAHSNDPDRSNDTSSAPVGAVCRRTIHELFEEQVRRTPHATALIHAHHSLTYSQLNQQANQLARRLVTMGAGPDRVVAIHLERSVEMVTALLATLKAGAGYLPLDPYYPVERLAYMIEDGSPCIVLTQAKLQQTLPAARTEILILDRAYSEYSQLADYDLSRDARGAVPDNLLYLIYTSGSTGRPKGTAMHHGAMVNLVEWHRESLPLRRGERVLQFAALSFDVAFQEVFSTLCLGGTLVLLDEWIRRDALALAEFLDVHRIQRLFVPPLMLQSLAECFRSAAVPLPQSLTDVITAGEQLRISPEIVALFDRLGKCRLHNHYGPTEAHVVTALTLSGPPTEWPTLPAIGRPIANTAIYVLDPHGAPVPSGVIGEIYIGGVAVARGYLNRPELTAERFLHDPFAADATARMYRTGDLGRWRADGNLEHLGRTDQQVKIRGFRIEPGEIEAQLARSEHVKEAVVVAREDAAGEKRLVAYICKRGQSMPNMELLRQQLLQTLPEYMVPCAFVLLENMPLTPSGKLDRRALPAPQLTTRGAGEIRGEEPHGELELGLASLWRELLHVEHVRRDDHFFDLGGDSLAAMKLAARISDLFAVKFRAHSIFRHPTLAQMAQSVQALLQP
jgi:amino acid adenylation domain-containing protein